MKFIIGTKKEMSQIFEANGEVIPVTIIEATPCVVTMVKKEENAIQIGCGTQKKLKKPIEGHLKKSGASCRILREFRYEVKNDEIKAGDEFGVEIFEAGNIIDARGLSKGKGFQGVVKRHGFAGSPASHGHKDQLRMPGSIGATDPAHVFKGKRMAGRMGGESSTVKNLRIVKIDEEKNLLYVKGAVPGARNSMVKIIGEGVIKVRTEKKAAEEAAVKESIAAA